MTKAYPLQTPSPPPFMDRPPIRKMGIITFFNLFTLFTALFFSPIPISGDPVPAIWPDQFHSVLLMNNTEGNLSKVDLYYDWPRGRNFNIIQHQLGKLLYDLEWDNGTSFQYTLAPDPPECKVLHFGVGILRPDWLRGATYLGQKYMDGFLCNVWEKVDFIWYYEDVVTKRPVFWRFFTGMIQHVITFEVGKVLDDLGWQAPVYCFSDDRNPVLDSVPFANLMKGFTSN